MSQREICKALKTRNEELKKITKESVLEALLLLMKTRAYDEISITDICNKAGISRNAFYKNFQTKENVFKAIVIDFNRNILRRVGNPFNKKTKLSWYVDFFNFIKENADFFLLIIKSNFQNLYLDLVNKILTSNKNLDQKTKYTRLLWNGATQNIIISWIVDGMKETPEEMAKICYNLLKFYKN